MDIGAILHHSPKLQHPHLGFANTNNYTNGAPICFTNYWWGVVAIVLWSKCWLATMKPNGIES